MSFFQGSATHLLCSQYSTMPGNPSHVASWNFLIRKCVPVRKVLSSLYRHGNGSVVSEAPKVAWQVTVWKGI